MEAHPTELARQWEFELNDAVNHILSQQMIIKLPKFSVEWLSL